MDIREYAQAFDQVEHDYEDAVAAFGIPFEVAESCPRERRSQTAAMCGCHCENGGGSLWRGWISPACLACRTGERTATFFVDLRCTVGISWASLSRLLQLAPSSIAWR